MMTVEKPKIIAEIGINHNGDISLAKRMIREAARCGASYVKFQSWQTAKLNSGPWDQDGGRQYLQSVELSDEQHYILLDVCKEHGVQFLTTCFDIDRIDFLKELGMTTIKISSCDTTNFRMLNKAAENFETLIISTGMASQREIDELCFWSLRNSDNEIYILDCISMYPTPLEKVHFNKLLYVKKFLYKNKEHSGHIKCGLSDHTDSITSSIMAMALGASLLEKHFTLNRDGDGPDHKFSLLPEQLKTLSEFIEEKFIIESNNIKEDIFYFQEEEGLRDIVRNRFNNDI